jgi:transcription elongation factor Elf1
MKISELDVSLYCSHCHNETLHRILYLNEKIYSTECTNCHYKTELNLNPRRELYKEIYKRICSKPARLTQEYKEDLSTFLQKIPKRVITKPYRLKKYVNETKQALKKLKE